MSDFGPEGVDLGSGMVGGFLSGLIGEGYSANAALRELRAQGGHMGRSQFLSLYGEVRAAVGNRPEIAGLDYSQVPSAEVFTPWAAGEPGRYATIVQTMVRRVGSTEWEPRYTTVVTDQPHSPQDAVDQAGDELSAQSSNYGTEVIGPGVVTSMNVTVAKGAA